MHCKYSRTLREQTELIRGSFHLLFPTTSAVRSELCYLSFPLLETAQSLSLGSGGDDKTPGTGLLFFILLTGGSLSDSAGLCMLFPLPVCTVSESPAAALSDLCSRSILLSALHCHAPCSAGSTGQGGNQCTLASQVHITS